MDEHATETYKSMISISVEGLKMLLLINGGAVVALLAYLGQSPQGANLAHRSWIPLGSFVFGIFASVLAFGGAYATQFALFNERIRPSAPVEGHMKCLRWTVVCVALSLLGFASGAFSSVWMLSK